MIPFPCSLSQRDYGNHHVVPAASHPFITKHARTGRDTQNGLGGITGFNPDLQSDLLLLVALDCSISAVKLFKIKRSDCSIETLYALSNLLALLERKDTKSEFFY
jgi:hypothetical protein